MEIPCKFPLSPIGGCNASHGTSRRKHDASHGISWDFHFLWNLMECPIRIQCGASPVGSPICAHGKYKAPHRNHGKYNAPMISTMHVMGTPMGSTMHPTIRFMGFSEESCLRRERCKTKTAHSSEQPHKQTHEFRRFSPVY